jgi:hypothetical protein
LKGRGFNFESTKMTKLERVEKLMGLLAIGFVWAHKVGEWRASIKPIKLIKFYNKRISPKNTYFRYGLDFLSDLVLHPIGKIKQFRECLKQISIIDQQVTAS